MLMPVTQQFGPGITGVQTPISLDYLPLSWITAVVDPIAVMAVLVEVTLDDVFDQDAKNYVSAATASWMTVVGAPTNALGYVTFPGPWRAIRLNIATNDTGVIFTVAQSTAPRA